ncbi:MAG TPA: hypothetical protein DCM57_04090 [Treponema sp.]|nr:hypothetical protein [Treponema sp.]HBB42461.1 hypothetical protein [Treponema sp.]
MQIDLKKIPCFGVAGNFTGHLEQAGEDKDFASMKTSDANAPKALFPTYIPGEKNGIVPDFLREFPFDADRIIYPEGENKLQIESECAIICNLEWKDGNVSSIKPVLFGASNDCSIRREGAKKISLKKNWGKSSKGLSNHLIPIDSFSSGGILDHYRIASFLVRNGKATEYGEDSAVKNYNYIYGRLLTWIVEKLNFQKNEGPAEDVGSYLRASGRPEKIMVSIGATRYTEFGQTVFLQNGDASVVVLYPETYSAEKIASLVAAKDFTDPAISVLYQQCVM